MLRYKILDLDSLLELYDFDDDEEDEIVAHFEQGRDLYVYSDGNIRAFAEDEVFEFPIEDFQMDEEEFKSEALEAGSRPELAVAGHLDCAGRGRARSSRWQLMVPGTRY